MKKSLIKFYVEYEQNGMFSNKQIFHDLFDLQSSSPLDLIEYLHNQLNQKDIFNTFEEILKSNDLNKSYFLFYCTKILITLPKYFLDPMLNKLHEIETGYLPISIMRILSRVFGCIEVHNTLISKYKEENSIDEKSRYSFLMGTIIGDFFYYYFKNEKMHVDSIYEYKWEKDHFRQVSSFSMVIDDYHKLEKIIYEKQSIVIQDLLKGDYKQEIKNLLCYALPGEVSLYHPKHLSYLKRLVEKNI